MAAITAIAAAGGPALRVVGDGDKGRWTALLILLFASLVWIAGRRAITTSSAPMAVVAVLGVAGGAAATMPLGGRAPWTVTVVGLAVSFIWVGRNTDGGSGEHHIPVFAFGLLIASEVIWIGGGSNSVTLALLAVAGLVGAAERLGLPPLPEAGRLLQLGLVRLGTLVGTLVLLLIAIPTLYLPGAFVRLGEFIVNPRRRWDDDRSGWLRRRTSVAEAQRDATHGFAPTARNVRVVRTAGGVAVLAAVAAVTYVGTRAPSPAPTNSTEGRSSSTQGSSEPTDLAAAIDTAEATPFSERAAFAGAGYADALQRELAAVSLVDDKTGGYQLGDFAGKYVNISGRERHTAPSRCSCPRATVWFVGGSAAFGLGQRDDHTIASELVGLASTDRLHLEVHNLGVPGWTIAEEYRAVRARLDSGAAPPDLVVFYDGYNDGIGTVVQTSLNGPDPTTPARLVDREVREFINSRVSIDSLGGGPTLGPLTAEKYRVTQRLAEDRLRGTGAATRYFFQPDALSAPVQRAQVEQLYRGIPLAWNNSDLGGVLESASTALADAPPAGLPGVETLRHLFDQTTTPVFYDAVHTNEAAARTVAAAIYSRIAADLHDRAH